MHGNHDGLTVNDNEETDSRIQQTDRQYGPEAIRPGRIKMFAAGTGDYVDTIVPSLYDIPW
jgi:hypothetical protein